MPAETTTSRPALPLRTRIATTVGAATSGVSRRLGRGGGSVIGGRALMAVDPFALGRLATGRRVALVSGTNGKTTTTAMLTAALTTVGPVASNHLGANLPPGIASALAAAPRARVAALEVDEAWLARVADQVAPAAVVLLNLSRDQLDRNNEVRTLATSWRRALADRDGCTVVANADDPLVVWGAGQAARAVWVAAGQPWTDDAGGCPSCGGRIRFAEGPWRCGDCDFSRPEPQVTLDGATVQWSDGLQVALDLRLPGRANRANATMAMVAAAAMGAEPAAASGALASLREVAGRYAEVSRPGWTARLLLSKNPAGWLEVFDFLRPPPIPVVVAINARIADGRDPSWLWDVPFERLAGRLVVATGERSRDLAVRLRYAGVEHVREPDLSRAIPAAAAPEVDVVANYTSFQQLRRLL